MTYNISELINLATPEKLRLIDALWDSIEEVPSEPARLTPEQQDEIRRRKAEMVADPSSALDWAEVERRLNDA